MFSTIFKSLTGMVAAILMIYGVLLSASTVASADERFDGKWRMNIEYSRLTSSNPRCSGYLLPDPMTISAGKLSGILNHSNRGTCFMRGAVKPDGKLQNALCQAGRGFVLQGQIVGDKGSGTFRDADTDTCDGRWTATKIK